MASQGLSYEQAAHILKELQELSEQHRIIVIGGQAVALWYRRLSELGYLSGAELAPLTSKDLDFRGARQTVQRAATLLNGEARLPTIDDPTPSTGLVMFVDNEGIKRQIDFLDAPYGLRSRDVVETAQHVVFGGPGDEVSAVVIHPERLMESRVHNVVGLRQRSQHAIRQARAAIECARAFSLFILDSAELEMATRVRAVLKLNERIYRFCRTARAREFVRITGLDPFDAVVVDDRLPPRFLETRYPQMRAALTR